MKSIRLGLAWALSVIAGVMSLDAFAQEWPNRPVRLVVPFPPGGASDLVARLVAPALGEKLKQNVLVENRPGGGTTIGAKAVLAANDAFHTLFVANSAPISIAPYLFDVAPYDPMKDFSHAAMIGIVANAFFVSTSIPVNTWPQLVEWIKAQGKPVPYGSGGGGSIGHIVGEMFKGQLGLKMEHIAYKGSAPMFQDMLGGQLHLGVNTLPEVWEFAKQGKLRIIALTGTTRARIAPDIPLVTELGHPKLVAENFVGLSGPANMPAAAVSKLNAAVGEVLNDARIIARLEEWGFQVTKMSPVAFTDFVQKQVTEFLPAVKASGAKLN